MTNCHLVGLSYLALSLLVDLNVKLRFWLQSDTFGKNRIGSNRIGYIWIQSDKFDEIWIHLETIG